MCELLGIQTGVDPNKVVEAGQLVSKITEKDNRALSTHYDFEDNVLDARRELLSWNLE